MTYSIIFLGLFYDFSHLLLVARFFIAILNTFQNYQAVVFLNFYRRDERTRDKCGK